MVGQVPDGGENILQGVGGVGVVDDDGVGRRDGDDLNAALHPSGRPQGGNDVGQLRPQVEGAGHYTQGVVDGESARNGEKHPTDGPLGHRLKFHMAGE